MMELLKTIQGSEAVYRLGWTLLHTLWLGAAVAALLAMALLILRRRSPDARYLAACAALVMLVALPVGTFFLVPGPVSAPPVDEGAVEAGGPIEPTFALSEPLAAAPPAEALVTPPEAGMPLETDHPLPAPPDVTASAKGTPDAPMLTQASRALEPALPWIVLAWATGVCALSLWQLGGWIAAGRLKRLARRPGRPDLMETIARLARAVGVSRPVRLLESILVKVPTVVGWLRPVILLPAGLATGLAPEQLEAILAHELAHIRRYDYLVNLLQSLIETLLFYHPAVWLISRRIRAERENCCDDIVVAAGAERFSYAESLLHVAQRSAAGQPRRRTGRSAAVAATGKPSQLRSRIGRIVGPPAGKADHRLGWLAGALAMLTVLAIVVGMSISSAADKPTNAAAAKEIERLWDRLESADSIEAYKAVVAMGKLGDAAVALIKARLRLPDISVGRIRQLIAKLDSDSFADRKQATSDLSQLGRRVIPVLRKALTEATSPEAKVRIEGLLKPWSRTSADSPVIPALRRGVRAMAVLERIGTPGAKDCLKNLAAQRVLPPVRFYDGKGFALKTGFVPDKGSILFGEPLFLTFVVRNVSSQPYTFRVGGANRGSVRDNNFRITATGPAGKAVQDPHSYRNRGGKSGAVTLQPGQIYTKRLHLGLWCKFAGPGEYAVACRRILNGPRGPRAVAVTSTFPLTIRPADAKKMREVIATWGAALRSGDKDEVLEATTVLAAIKDEAVIPHLIESLKMKEWRHKSMVVNGLARFNSDAAADGLCLALKDPDYAVARDAAKALKRTGKINRAVDKLLAELEALETADRAVTIRALGYTRARHVGSTLVAALQHENTKVRQAAAEGLGWLGYWEHIPILKKCLTGDDLALRVAAVRALVRLAQPIEPKWLVDVILAAKGKKGIDLPRSFLDATSMLRLHGRGQAATALVSCLEFGNPKTNSSYNFYIIHQIEGCRNGPPKFWSEGKYHHDPNTEGTPDQIKDNRLALAEWKKWLAKQEAVKRSALPKDVTKALAEAMKIRVKHHNAGLAMWRELAALVKPGWTVQQMRLILKGPGGGMSHSNGRVTISYGVQGAFMVTAKGKYVRGASYEHRDGEDKIVLTHPPTVVEIRLEKPAEKKTDAPEGGSAAPVDGEKAGRQRLRVRSKVRLLKAFKAAKYDWMQIQPAKELIALGDKSVVPEMLEILKSKDRRRRCNAGWVLAGLGDERGLAAVLAELKDVGERPTNRTRSDGKPDLKGQIVSDRYYAAHVLGQIGDRRALPALIAVLRDESIGYQAAIVLGQLGDRRAIPALKELLKNTKDSQRKTEWMYAGYALAKIGDPAGLPVLVDFLTSASWVDRRRAARAMGGIRNSRAVGALVKSLADGNPNVRVAVAEALGKIGDESAIPALQKLSADTAKTTSGRPRTVRDVAATAIRKITSAKKSTTKPGGKGSRELSPTLLKERDGLLKKADAEIRNGLVKLAERFPHLKKSKYWKTLSSPSSGGRIGISYFHTDRGKGRTTKEPMSERERVRITVVVRPPPTEFLQLAMAPLYPNLGLVGAIGVRAGDPELNAAVKKLVADALAPLKKLNARSATQPAATKERAAKQVLPPGETLLTIGSFRKVKAFILDHGDRRTYCNMFNNNPHVGVGDFDIFLDPDTGPKNPNCDPKLSDFNHMTIRSKEPGKPFKYHRISLNLKGTGPDLIIPRGTDLDLLRRCFRQALAAAAKATGPAPKGASTQPATGGSTGKAPTKRAPSVSGRVLDEPGGGPAAGVAVTLKLYRNGRLDSQLTGRTDKNGRYVFRVAKGEAYAGVSIDLPPGVWSRGGRAYMKVGEKGSQVPDLYVATGQTVSGTVRDVKTGKPVPGAVMGVSVAKDNPSRVRADAGGRFKLYVLPRELTVHCYGNVTSHYPPEPNRTRAVTVPAGRHIRGIDFRVPQAPSFTGLVTLPDGKPAKGAEVVVIMWWPLMPRGPGRILPSRKIPGPTLPLRLKTDAEGRFRGYFRRSRYPDIPNLAPDPGTKVKMRIVAFTTDRSAGALLELETQTRAKQRGPIKLALGQAGSATIRITDAEDRGVANARILATRLRHVEQGGSATYGFAADPGVTARHLGDGRYSLTGLIPGPKYDFMLTARGYTRGPVYVHFKSKNRRFTPGQKMDLGQMQLEPLRERQDATAVLVQEICDAGAMLGQTSKMLRKLTGREFRTPEQVLQWWWQFPLAERVTRRADLDERRLEELWAKLAGKVGLEAHKATLTMAAGGQRAAAFLAERVKPVSADTQRIKALIGQLGSPKYGVRREAFAELSRIGRPAEAALRAALKGEPSVDARQTISKLLEACSRPYPVLPEARRVARAIRVLELIGTPQAVQLLEGLSRGTPRAHTTEQAKAAILRRQSTGPPPPAAEESKEALEARIAELIERLGSTKFSEREEAQKELVKIGPPALVALRKAVGGQDPEGASRAKAALSVIRRGVRRERAKESRISLYLVSDPPGTFEAQEQALTDLKLQGEPLLIEEDFIAYDAVKFGVYDALKQVLRLTDEARALLAVRPGVSGVPFVVVVDGKRWYLGAFWSRITSMAASRQPKMPVTFIDGTDRPAGKIGIRAPRLTPRTDAAIRKRIEALNTPSPRGGTGTGRAEEPAKGPVAKPGAHEKKPATPPATQPGEVGSLDERLQRLWVALGSADPKEADKAVKAMVALGDRAVAFLAERLQPAPADAGHVKALVAKLDDADYAVRKKAVDELMQLGRAALPVLKRALKHPKLSVEARARIQGIVKNCTGSTQMRRFEGGVEVLARIGTARARGTLRRFARGDPTERLTRRAHAALTPWGKAANGLQLRLVVSKPGAAGIVLSPKGKLSAKLDLRNVTDRPISVAAAREWPLGLVLDVTRPDGSTERFREIHTFEEIAWPEAISIPAGALATVPVGFVLRVSRRGMQGEPFEGQVTMKAILEIAKGSFRSEFWEGRAEGAPLIAVIRNSRMQPAVRPGSREATQPATESPARPPTVDPGADEKKPAAPPATQPAIGESPGRPAVPAKASAARIAELVTQLGSDDYKQREKAQQALVQVGIPAIPALRAAASDRDPERATRATTALAQIKERIAALRAFAGRLVRDDTPVTPKELGKVKELKLQFSDLTDAALTHLKLLTSLESLGPPYRMTDAGMAHVAGLANLRELSLRYTQVTDAGLVHLRGLGKLESLSLPDRATDAGLVHLDGLTRLKKLRLDHTKVTAKGLARLLQGRTQLTELGLSLIKLTDAGLVHLKGMTHLKYLHIGNSRVTDAGMAHLKGLTRLEHLEVSNCRITDAGLANIEGMSRLKFLDVGYNKKITDAGLKRLKGLKNLETLSLRGTGITDAGLKHLAGMTQLTKLGLVGTKVSGHALKEVRDLPKLRLLLLTTSQAKTGIEHLKAMKKLSALLLSGRPGEVNLQRLKDALPPGCMISISPPGSKGK